MRHKEKTEEYKQLRKLSRSDLLELLLEQTQKNDQLELENNELKMKIEEQRAAIAEAGSIAESARRLSDLIERAEKAQKAVERNSTGKVAKQETTAPENRRQGMFGWRNYEKK